MISTSKNQTWRQKFYRIQDKKFRVANFRNYKGTELFKNLKFWQFNNFQDFSLKKIQFLKNFGEFDKISIAASRS
mgnify:CR=1 FL=1